MPSSPDTRLRRGLWIEPPFSIFVEASQGLSYTRSILSLIAAYPRRALVSHDVKRGEIGAWRVAFLSAIRSRTVGCRKCRACVRPRARCRPGNLQARSGVCGAFRVQEPGTRCAGDSTRLDA